jgi:hypothetical protein
MPVAMTTPLESKSERTNLNTQELPTVPTVQEMKNSDAGRVLQWIQQRNPNILIKEDNLNNFKEACIADRAFLALSVEHFQTCGLPPGVGLALKKLVDGVKEGKFIPRT